MFFLTHCANIRVMTVSLGENFMCLLQRNPLKNSVEKHLICIIATHFIISLSLCLCSISVIHHWTILRSSYRKLAWPGQFHLDALIDWATRPWIQFALGANFVQLFQFHLFSVSDFISNISAMTNIYGDIVMSDETFEASFKSIREGELKNNQKVKKVKKKSKLLNLKLSQKLRRKL